MLCDRCGTHKGIKEYNDMLLCDYCFKIKTTADNIIDIVCANEHYYSEGFNDGYSQCMKDV